MRTKILLFSFIFYSFSLHCQIFIEVTVSNRGQTINFDSSQVLEIKLPCQPSTGYGWYIIEIDTSVIKQIGNWDFIPDTNNINNIMVGQPGTEVIRFIGVSQGTSELTLEYKRP